MKIRRMETADIPAALDLTRIANWNQIEGDWCVFLRPPDGNGWIAEGDGAVLGTITTLRYGDSFRWLSMMLVHPEARRTGIGTRLMEAALESGEDCFRLDATPLGEPLYRRFGFEGEYELVRATIHSVVSRANDVRPMQTADFPAVFARDREVFGADRSSLLRSFYQRAPDLAWVASDGYCFGRPGHRYWQIGPVVTSDIAVARHLINACITPGRTLAIDTVPSHSVLLESLGFTTERPFLRMRRGANLSPGLPELQFAIAGPEFG